MSPPTGMMRCMITDSTDAMAAELGMEHAELDHLRKLQRRLRTGNEVAAALGLDHVPNRDLLALREAYDSGWSSWA